VNNTDARVLNLSYESEPTSSGLVGYVLNNDRRAYNSPELRGAMFDYILGADGLFLHAKREELEVCFPIAPAEVRGLGELFETFAFNLPKVPENVVDEILHISLSYAQHSMESLFWLRHSPLNPYDNGWLLEEPAQTRSAGSCRPHDGQEDLYDRVIIEIHSHHGMRPEFSRTDDADERGFRLYGVVGNLPEKPQIRMRVGVYGYFWEIPATWALQLPEGLADCIPDPEEVEVEYE
jgi:PRTRC genetic system protein A